MEADGQSLEEPLKDTAKHPISQMRQNREERSIFSH